MENVLSLICVGLGSWMDMNLRWGFQLEQLVDAVFLFLTFQAKQTRPLAMVDRISNLPDEVLCHILSFLPTEYVVATSVLSKRWRPLWISVPTLDFEYQRYVSGNNRSGSSFIHFVYATILGRGFQQPIKSFRLICDSPVSDTTIWLNAAMQGQVENLEIGMLRQLPFSIFSSTTLVVLKLFGVSFRAFPSSVDLPSLKHLHLINVASLKAQYVIELLYGCPILENLEANYVACYSNSFEEKFTSLPKLVQADLSYLERFPIAMTAFSNVEFLRLIQCFHDVTIPEFPNLTHMELSFGGPTKWNSVLDMLNLCPQLQTFVLNLYYVRGVWTNPHDVPECIFSHLRKCFLINYTGKECQMRFAKYILQNSASLLTMTICTEPKANDHIKLGMIVELASCPRSSTACELLFK